MAGFCLGVAVQVTEFEDHRLYNQETNTNSIYINTHQDLIISYCQPNRPGTAGGAGTSHYICVANTATP